MTSLRVLFVKSALHWPGASGHDVHTLQTARALAELGHDVHLATRQPLAAQALAALDGVVPHVLAAISGSPLPVTPTASQERFRRYWGVEPNWLERLASLVVDLRPAAVVSVGLDALPYLLAVPDGTTRVWYAADEWVRHHLSLIEFRKPDTWGQVRAAAVKGMYERAYAPLVDVAWVVSEKEQSAANRWAGMRADIIANGVDSHAFRPLEQATLPYSAVFWGTLDFEPNLQGLAWFLRRVWPAVRQARQDARFTIIGLRPGPDAHAMADAPGVELIADAPDVRPLVTERQVVVLPFVSGGGIKNKLLEAAALEMAVVVTPKGTEGLVNPAQSGLAVCGTAEDFAKAILAYWAAPDCRTKAARLNRAWVEANHSWATAGERAAASIARRTRTFGG